MTTLTSSYFWLTMILVLSLSTSISAQHLAGEHTMAHEASGAPQWEGSPEGIAYSEFNHHMFAAFVLLIGLSELRATFALRSLAWAQFILPLAMLLAGGYLLGWSDHEAWPIGSLSFTQTFLGEDREIVQHKLFALLALGVGTFEGVRWYANRKALAWTRFVLPFAILVAGGYLLGWSDHDAWPIGSLSFSQTFFAEDWEILQHKLFGLLALAVGTFEALRWYGNRKALAWTLPLPILAVVGGLMLFLHQHGNHPGAHSIMMHHLFMGSTAIAAGSSRLATSGGIGGSISKKHWAWRLAWPGLLLLIALELWMYRDGPSG